MVGPPVMELNGFFNQIILIFIARFDWMGGGVTRSGFPWMIMIIMENCCLEICQFNPLLLQN